MKTAVALLASILVALVIAGFVSAQTSNPIARWAQQGRPGTRGYECRGWAMMTRNDKTTYLLGALSMADHLYLSANVIPEVLIDPDDVVFFPRSAVFYAPVIDQLCSYWPPSTNVVTLLFMSK